MNYAIFFLTVFLVISPATAATFSDYAVQPVQVSSVPPLNGKDYRLFRTRANDLLKSYREGREKTLAGHVIFTTFGCGTECVVLMGINLLSGEVRTFDIPAFEYEIRSNSRLIIINKGGLALSTMSYPEQQFVVDEGMRMRQIK